MAFGRAGSEKVSCSRPSTTAGVAYSVYFVKIHHGAIDQVDGGERHMPGHILHETLRDPVTSGAKCLLPC